MLKQIVALLSLIILSSQASSAVETHNIGTYRVMSFVGKSEVVRIYLNDVNNKYLGYVDFIEGYSGTTKFIVHSNGIVNAYMPLSKLHSSLDILRNEKPVKFQVNEDYNWAAFITGNEPVGESE